MPGGTATRLVEVEVALLLEPFDVDPHLGQVGRQRVDLALVGRRSAGESDSRSGRACPNTTDNLHVSVSWHDEIRATDQMRRPGREAPSSARRPLPVARSSKHANPQPRLLPPRSGGSARRCRCPSGSAGSPGRRWTRTDGAPLRRPAASYSPPGKCMSQYRLSHWRNSRLSLASQAVSQLQQSVSKARGAHCILHLTSAVTGIGCPRRCSACRRDDEGGSHLVDGMPLEDGLEHLEVVDVLVLLVGVHLDF